MHILFLETIHEKTKQWLNEQEGINCWDLADINETVKINIEAIVTRGIGRIDQTLLENFPNTKVVARCGVGLDNIDTVFCKENGIPVIYAPGSNAQTTAEQTMTLMLMLQRNAYHAVKEVKNGNWQFRNAFVGDEIFGKTLGILGMGNIGSKVAAMSSAFNMEIQYFSRSVVSIPYKRVTLDELANSSDIISVHLPLNEQTHGLLNKDFFQKCKAGVLIINTARDQIVDREALIKSLNSGKIGGYASDVPMSPYPAVGDPLITHSNTIITPHVSSLTERTFYTMCQKTMENVVSFLKNGTVLEPECIYKK